MENLNIAEAAPEIVPAPVYLVNLKQKDAWGGDGEAYATVKITIGPVFWGVVLGNLATGLVFALVYALSRM